MSFPHNIAIDRYHRVNINFCTELEGLILDNTFVRQSEADRVFYPDVIDTIRTANWTASTDYHGFMKFNIAGYSTPVSSAILRVFFTLYANDTNELQSYSIRNLSDLTDTDEWDQETITWNNQPLRDVGSGDDTVLQVDLPWPELLINGNDPGGNGFINKSYDFNITGILNPYITAGLDTATLVFQRFNGHLQFSSTRNLVVANRPQLFIQI